MATGPGFLGGGATFGQPGTSGSLSSIFSDQAMLHKKDRLEREQKEDEAGASRMNAVTNTGQMAIKQAEFASKSRDLQQAKLSSMQTDKVVGADQFQNINPDPNANIWDKAKQTFSSQGVEAVKGAEGAGMTPAAEKLGMKVTPAVDKLSGGDLADSLDDVMNPPPVSNATTAVKGAADATTKGGVAAAAEAGKGGLKSALGTGMNVAGGVAGVAGAVGGANKMMKSETTAGKAGGALQVAGGLGSAAMAAGLLSGPIGWGAMGASLLGGFLND